MSSKGLLLENGQPVCYPDPYNRIPAQPTEEKPGQLPFEQIKKFFAEVSNCLQHDLPLFVLLHWGA